MKFLTDEWFEQVMVRANAHFNKPGKMTLTFCEVCTDCPEGDPTKWIYYDIKNGQIAEAKLGCGEAPAADFRGKGAYADHVRICKGELDPKKAVMDKVVAIENNQGSVNPLKLVKLIDMYMKMTDAKRIPGIEY